MAAADSDRTYDVVVVGGGVLGTAIAARLAATTARVCLVEAAADVADGASKGNAGIAVSYYGDPGSLETRLIVESTPAWERLAERLDVPYRRSGGLVVALTAEEEERLPAFRDDARACGARAELLDGRQARALEPLVADGCRAAVHLPDEGLVDPMRLTVAYARLAAANGCAVLRGTPVTGILRDGHRLTGVVTPRGGIRARFVVNAAGLGAGRLSELAGGEPLRTWPRKGEYLLVDREVGRRLRTIVFGTPLPDTKGVNVVPTTHGSLLLGPTASDHEAEDDRGTDAATLDDVFARARRLVPSLRREHVVKAYAANRPASDERFRLRLDARVPNLLHATNRSAGVSISPAIGAHALALLRDAGLDAADRSDAIDDLPAVPRLRTDPHPERLTALDPAYGQVVCACEQVSAAEIAAALAGPLGARSVEGVRKRTGATYGRCQGAICLAGVSFLCAMATGTGPADVALTERGALGA